MAIEIRKIGITVAQERTWGRVYMDYIENKEEKFIFRNYLKFEKKNFSGAGSFEKDSTFKWFEKSEITEDYMSVLEEEYDFMDLTSDRYKAEYGTPSKILKSLIEDVDQNLMDDIAIRKGWYK